MQNIKKVVSTTIFTLAVCGILIQGCQGMKPEKRSCPRIRACKYVSKTLSSLLKTTLDKIVSRYATTSSLHFAVQVSDLSHLELFSWRKDTLCYLTALDYAAIKDNTFAVNILYYCNPVTNLISKRYLTNNFLLQIDTTHDEVLGPESAMEKYYEQLTNLTAKQQEYFKEFLRQRAPIRTRQPHQFWP